MSVINRIFLCIMTLMKKILAIALILTTVSIIPVSASIEHKVIKVIDGDTVYIDFNDNGIAEQDEKVRINGIDTFETKLNDGLNWQMKLYNLTQDEALGLGYYGKEFAKKELLNKPVRAEYTAEEKFDKNNRHLMSLYYDCDRQGKCKSYEQEVLKAGLATIYTKSNLADELKPYQNLDKIKANAKKSHKLNLVVLNKKNGKYHKLDCKYGWMSSQQEIVNKPLVKYAPASCCYINHTNEKLKHIEKSSPDVHTEFIDIYFQDPTKYKKPANYARTAAAQRLLEDIVNAKSSIEFAIYGIGGQPEIFNAIVAAKNQGLLVRGVTDMDKNYKNEYSDTQSLIDILGKDTLKTDFYYTKIAENERDKYIKEHWNTINANEYKGFTERAKYFIDSKQVDLTIKTKDILLVQKGIMHNKVFVIDKRIVWTGSTNISSSGIGGYNANVMSRIDNPKIAELYSKEISQMNLQEKFHQAKSVIPNNEKITIDKNTVISVYFLPKHKPVEKEIRPLLQNAKNRIYVPMFYLTHNDIIQDLIEAKQKRHIDIRVILDASGAKNLYTKHYLLRQAGIPVKVENWGGKMHMKSAIIDDVFILGSMNWTKSGTTNNDENLVIIYNKQIADYAAEYFKYLEKSIPNKWLHADPNPEGKDSINSCTDGLDNDHDGLIDSDCPYCLKFFHKKSSD